jgi:methionyl-tRNA formyltransferase
VAKNASETPQDEAQASFTTQLDKSQSQLQPALKTAQTLSNEVRAFAGFPKSKLELLGIPCVITQAHAASSPVTELDQQCKDGQYLIIDRLIPENSKEMDATGFLNGHKK